MSDYNEILKYIKNTPENTNPAIIKSMLDNYEKPAGGVGNILNINNQSSIEVEISSSDENGNPVMIIGNELKLYWSIPAADSASLCIISQKKNDEYYVIFGTFTETDILNITVNGTPLVYDDGYMYASQPSESPIAGQTYNVVITNKQV